MLRALPGGRTDAELCDPRVRELVRVGERCERVEGQVHVGYLPFDAEIHFAQATGRAVRIRLVLRDLDQWSRKAYDEVLRGVERIYCRAAPFLPLGASFEDHCAAQIRRARLGEPIEPSALVPPHCEVAHAIEGKGGRIALELCVREPCPGSANLLTPAALGVAGRRVLDIEATAARAPGEPIR